MEEVGRTRRHGRPTGVLGSENISGDEGTPKSERWKGRGRTKIRWREKVDFPNRCLQMEERCGQTVTDMVKALQALLKKMA